MDIQFTLLGEKIDAVLSLLKEKSSCNCGRKEELIQWHSKEDVMRHLRISPATYYNWRKRGILKPINSDGEDRYTTCQLNKIALGRGYRERMKYDK